MNASISLSAAWRIVTAIILLAAFQSPAHAGSDRERDQWRERHHRSQWHEYDNRRAAQRAHENQRRRQWEREHGYRYGEPRYVNPPPAIYYAPPRQPSIDFFFPLHIR